MNIVSLAVQEFIFLQKSSDFACEDWYMYLIDHRLKKSPTMYKNMDAFRYV